MKMIRRVLLSLLLSISGVHPLALPHHQASRFLVKTTTNLFASSTSTDADEYLQQCIQEWNELEKELHEVKEIKDKNAAAELAENMLKKALNAVAAKKYAEIQHEVDAKARIKEASDQEVMAEELLQKAHKDVEAAQSRVDMLEGSIDDVDYEDRERFRDLAVVHTAHLMEEDASKILDDAHHAANSAVSDLMDAHGQLTVLEVNEDNLKLALQELHKLRNEYSMSHWHDKEIDHEYYDNLYWKYTM